LVGVHSDDEPPELAFYWPDCAEREFSEDWPIERAAAFAFTRHPTRA
jgi:hypothetical protein